MEKVAHPSSKAEGFGGLADTQRLGAPDSVRPSGNICITTTALWHLPMSARLHVRSCAINMLYIYVCLQRLRVR
jgi:hypothetical protein